MYMKYKYIGNINISGRMGKVGTRGAHWEELGGGDGFAQMPSSTWCNDSEAAESRQVLPARAQCPSKARRLASKLLFNPKLFPLLGAVGRRTQ